MTQLEMLNPDTAPQPRAPLSSAIRWDQFVFVSGQVPRTVDGQEETGSATAQTHVVIANLKAILEAAGSGLDRVLKTTVFLTDMADFAEVNAVYAEAFGDHRPTRSAVQVAALGKPGFRVEIEAMAVLR